MSLTKEDKIAALFDPDRKDLLLSDFLAATQVREETMKHLGVRTEKEFLDALGVDFYYLSFRDLSQNESLWPFYKGPDLLRDDDTRICPFGIKWKREVGEDKFGVDEALSGPFSRTDIREEDILNHPWPEPGWFDFSALAKECKEYSDKIVVGGLWSGIYGDSNRMMGYENFLLNIAMNRPLIKVLVDRMTDFYLAANQQYFEVVQGKMDIFFMGNDFGAQNGLVISEEDWEDIFYNNYKRLIDLAHGYGLKVMVHSCGGIGPLLPRLIELGVDVIDPVQTTAEGMDPGTLALKFGSQMVFHGALDTQKVFPFGTREEVETHCVELVNALNSHGNFIVAPANNFMPGTPPENIEKAYQVINQLKSSIQKKS